MDINLKEFWLQLIQMSLESTVRECELLKKELQVITQIKNNTILELERSLAKSELHSKRCEERIRQLESEAHSLKERNKELELFSRERSHALTQKNIRIAQLQDQLENRVKHQSEKWRNQVQVLKTIIADQQSEMALYLQDHHHYLRELEQLQEPYRYLHEERRLTLSFNEELLAQIAQSEQAGIQLQDWAQKAHLQLKHQNEQGNDLLGQVQYMISEVSQ